MVERGNLLSYAVNMLRLLGRGSSIEELVTHVCITLFLKFRRLVFGGAFEQISVWAYVVKAGMGMCH